MAVITFIDEIEDVAEIVAEDLYHIVEGMTDALAPDGRPLGMRKQSEREQLRDYVQTLRGNPDAWVQRVRDIATEITQSLVGQPPEVVASVHPYSIAMGLMWEHSARMEARLKREEAKAGTKGDGDGETA